jgi:hypothetical protein
LNEELGRNDPCFCGSAKKYKNCHLKPFYPSDFFNAPIKEFEDIKVKAEAPIEVGRIDVYYRHPYPWDEGISKLLKSLTEIVWNQEDRWQNRIKNRIDKLRHKLDALQYHTGLFKSVEMDTENSWKKNMVANISLNKIFDDPRLIYNFESFLFQSKSCLDVFAQIIAYSFKSQITSYADNGDRLVKILEKEPSKNYPQYASKVIDLIKENRSWVKELVEMRDEVTHYSDLIGLSCFLTKKSEESDRIATVFYPAMPNGQRVSKFMDKTWINIHNLIQSCGFLIANLAIGKNS